MQEERILTAGTEIELPYTRDAKSGSPVKISLPQDMSESDVQQFVNTNFPRTMGMLALQASEFGADPLTREEFDLLKKSGGEQVIQQDRAKAKSNIASMANSIGGVVKNVADGALELLSIAGETVFPFATDWSPENAASQNSYPGLKVQAAKVIEGFARGSQDLYGAGALGIERALGLVGLSDEYDRYNLLKRIERDELSRKSGGTAMISEQFVKENPQIAESAEKLSNVLDFSLLVPGLGFAGKAGKVGLGRKILATGLEVGGAAAEMPAKMAGKVAESISSEGIKVGGLAAITGVVGAKAAAAGAALGAAGAIGGKFSRYAGMLLGSEEAASKIIAEALEKEAGPLSRMTLNGIATFVPDGAVRVARSAVDGAIDASLVGGALGYARASSDPFNTGYDISTQTIAAAAGAGLLGGAMGGLLAGGKEAVGLGKREAYIREIASDLSERPDTKSVSDKGVEFSVGDERLNREKVASAEDMTPEQKMALFGVLGSAERNGMDVVFVNDSTKLPDSLGGSGAGMGAGVSVIGTEKPVIVVNSDRITGTKAIEEVVHATISDTQARKIVADMVQSSGSIYATIEQMKPFAEAYINQTAENNPQRAESLREKFNIAQDTSAPADVRTENLLEISHEYIAKGIAEKLSSARPEQLIEGRGKNVISNFVNKALTDIATAIESPSSGASFDVITGHFYKDGKLVVDPVISKMADNVLTNLKNQEGLRSVDRPIAGDPLPDGSKVIAGPDVMKSDARPRYEDLNSDGTPTTPKQKTEIHHKVYDSLAEILGEQAVDKAKAAAGVYSGNVKRGTIISNRRLSDAQLAGLFEAKTPNGELLINPNDRGAVERWNQASGDSHLVNITNDVSTSKTREAGREYFRRSSVVLPLGFQSTKGKTGGGLVLPYFNMSLLNEVTNYQRKFTKTIDKALSEFGINKTEDWVPVVKRYLENYSSGTPRPAAEAILDIAPKGVSLESAKAIRDLIHLSGSGPRIGEQRINEPTIKLKAMPQEVLSSVVDIYGKKVGEASLQRDRNAFAHIRADSLRDVSLFQPNGVPVKVDLDLQKAMPLVRALFSPGENLKREKIGSSEVLTDTQSGKRIIIDDSGRATLFEKTARPAKFKNIDEAKDYANRDNAPAKQQATQRSARNQFTKQELVKLSSELMYGDIKGSKAKQELRAVQKAIREANRSPEDMPAWVEEREFLSETERRVQTEARKRRKQRQEIARQAEEFWSGNVKAEAEPMAESVPQKQKRVAASPEVLESLAATEVPNKPKLKITEITPTPKKQKAVKSFADLEVGGLKEFVEPTAKAEPKPKPQVTDLLGQQSYRYTVGMQKADAKVAQAKSDFLVKLAGWEADAKKRLSELEPDVKKKIEDVRETAAKVEEIPVDMEPEPPKSGSSEMPETQIPNVATAADDARVPRDFAIKKSASRKFSVYTIGSSAVQAVADSYREALLLAHKKRNEKLKRK